MKWLLARLKEKSTWLGIFTMAGLFGMKIEPELREAIINAILAVAAVAAFVFREETKHEQALPPIDLVGRSENHSPASETSPPSVPRYPRYRDPDDDGLSESQPAEMQPNGPNESGWNN